MLKIIPLGGLGEIGLNMMLMEFEETIFVVDAGLMFPEDYMLGVDYVIPDMGYLKENAAKVAGVVLTHAHEDHIGALPYLLRLINCPVFGTPFTLGLVRHRLEEHDLIENARLHDVLAGEIVRLGPFQVEFIQVGHSVVDGVGLAVRTPVGLLVHTGDFKINHTRVTGANTDVNTFARLGQEGVLALLSDSTNVEKEGYTISDKEIGETLSRIIMSSTGRVIVALFASNIMRIQQIVDIAAERGNKIAVNGKSLEISVHLAKSMGYLNIPEGMEIQVGEIRNYADRDVVIITTGSQGEPMSALARMAAGTHKQLRIKEGDTVLLSSKFIPGNEKAIGNIINNLYRRGADVIYEKISEIHVSGHAFREELKLMISLTRPRFFIPIHGEYRHLVLHGRLAQSVGIPEERILLADNGQIIEFDEFGIRAGDTVATGRILIDGKGIGDVGRSVLKERRILSEDGLVVVTMAFDEETGIVVYGPEIVSRGFVFKQDTGHLIEDAQCVVLEIVEEVEPGYPNRVAEIRTRLQKALRQYFFFTIGRRPVILPFLLEV
ncbi:Ribonuclease J (endonuclease and 5' exonuclease) [Olavius algarvensis associated proteobacterium Delta 3]|nr:Ribonuclease J (endonuclease and 5' exonuclease) [Olavius algarvensis associated proteobacterium Delta 3]CAB5130205.1 Ribonuclease J (endonuclease and 5' exonuclease) [Olavius algarvensis associated proteobacterium Delta 3]